jgi:hypothetical protein
MTENLNEIIEFLKNSLIQTKELTINHTPILITQIVEKEILSHIKYGILLLGISIIPFFIISIYYIREKKEIKKQKKEIKKLKDCKYITDDLLKEFTIEAKEKNEEYKIICIIVFIIFFILSMIAFINSYITYRTPYVTAYEKIFRK